MKKFPHQFINMSLFIDKSLQFPHQLSTAFIHSVNNRNFELIQKLNTFL